MKWAIHTRAHAAAIRVPYCLRAVWATRLTDVICFFFLRHSFSLSRNFLSFVGSRVFVWERSDFHRVRQCVHVTRSELMKTIKTISKTTERIKTTWIVTSERIENSLRSHRNLFPVCATGKSVYAAQSSSHTLTDHLAIVFSTVFSFFRYVVSHQVFKRPDNFVCFKFFAVVSVRWLRGRLSTETYIIAPKK